MRSRFLTIAMALSVGFIACNRSRDASAPPVIPSFFGPPKSLRIPTTGLSFTTLGQSRQLTANATFSNGAVRDVAKLAEWRSTNPAVATVDAGLLKIVAFGNTEITATYSGITSAASVVSAKAIVTLSSIAITGPAELAPGTSAQFTATGNYNDGSTQDLTSTVTWATFSPNMRHAGAGRFEALGAGDGFVNANTGGRFASKAVIVVPSGTFKLSGAVRDASGGLEGVVVEVVSGTGAGLRTTTGFNGSYALFGVAGQVQLRVSASGYGSQDFSQSVNSHATRDLSISPISSPVDISGQWTMTVTTSSACSAGWPAPARRREVPAAFTQNGTRLNVRFTGTQVVFPFTNTGRIAGTSFWLALYYDTYYLDYGLTERISPTEWVGINGVFEGTATGSSIAGNFAGTFNYYVTTANAQFPTGLGQPCAADAPFEFRR